jgi:hypothetical protein
MKYEDTEAKKEEISYPNLPHAVRIKSLRPAESLDKSRLSQFPRTSKPTVWYASWD